MSMVEDGGGCYTLPLKKIVDRDPMEAAADIFINPNMPKTALIILRKLAENDNVK